jgi:hypothetical protein
VKHGVEIAGRGVDHLAVDLKDGEPLSVEQNKGIEQVKEDCPVNRH